MSDCDEPKAFVEISDETFDALLAAAKLIREDTGEDVTINELVEEAVYAHFVESQRLVAFGLVDE